MFVEGYLFRGKKRLVFGREVIEGGVALLRIFDTSGSGEFLFYFRIGYGFGY